VVFDTSLGALDELARRPVTLAIPPESLHVRISSPSLTTTITGEGSASKIKLEADLFVSPLPLPTSQPSILHWQVAGEAEGAFRVTEAEVVFKPQSAGVMVTGEMQSSAEGTSLKVNRASPGAEVSSPTVYYLQWDQEQAPHNWLDLYTWFQLYGRIQGNQLIPLALYGTDDAFEGEWSEIPVPPTTWTATWFYVRSDRINRAFWQKLDPDLDPDWFLSRCHAALFHLVPSNPTGIWKPDAGPFCCNAENRCEFTMLDAGASPSPSKPEAAGAATLENSPMNSQTID
jgi:hypothetical protein